MQRFKNTLSSPFGSAVAGGLVVAAIGLGAIEAGWVGDDAGSNPSSAAPSPQAQLVSNDGGSDGKRRRLRDFGPAFGGPGSDRNPDDIF